MLLLMLLILVSFAGGRPLTAKQTRARADNQPHFWCENQRRGCTSLRLLIDAFHMLTVRLCIIRACFEL